MSNESQAENHSQDAETTMPPLKVDPNRASTLLQNISSIRSRISTACTPAAAQHQPRLVAVSKLKPATDILALHHPSDPSQAQLHFGENYVQELIQKSQLLPKEIRWHFIGGLQSNKCAQLAREVQSLWAVESIDSVKKAQLLEKGRIQRNEQLGQDDPLRVFVQVNTSGEDSKSGVEPKSQELLDVCKSVRDSKSLKLQGVMTIGAIARSKATTPETENEDFINLRENRDWVAAELGMDAAELELSMGMSEDFEGAIRQGSNEVRVGSTIFGERPPKSEAKVLESTEEEKK